MVEVVEGVKETLDELEGLAVLTPPVEQLNVIEDGARIVGRRTQNRHVPRLGLGHIEPLLMQQRAQVRLGSCVRLAIGVLR